MGESRIAESVVLDTESKITEENRSIEVNSFMSPCAKENDEIKLIGNGEGGELCPITPSPNSETIEISSNSDQTDDVGALSDCETPTGSIFDPFAPGDEELFALAPKKKMVRETRIPIRRQLNFDISWDSTEEKVESAVAEEDEEESNLLQSLCESFLELIVWNQIKEISAESIVEEGGISSGLTTPTGLRLLTGIAETCPDAPVRPSLKSRRLNLSICRKLEFEGFFI